MIINLAAWKRASSRPAAASILLLFSLVWGLPSLAAQEAKQSPNETWFGVLDVKVAKLRLEVRLKQQPDGTVAGDMYSLDQTSQPFPCDSLTLDDKTFSWKVKSLGASFDGKLNADGDVASGEFKQGGVTAKMKFKKVEKTPTRELTQVWQGKMKAGAQEFDFQFRVLKEADGTNVVFLDSFTENVGDLACTLTHEGDQVSVEVPITDAKFIGTMNEAHDTIAGTWFQRGAELPLTIKSVPLTDVREVKLERPQTPQPPFEYDVEELEIKNDAGGSVLAGTLTSPKGTERFPVVILISGSGPQDRDETIFNHKPFLVIADHLAKSGIAAFRFDDRGVGKSQGAFTTATSADFASDVNAIVDRLKQHRKIDPTRIALAGHSEGGVIAPMVASQRNDIAAMILLAGTGVNGKEITLNQSRLIAAGSGAPAEILDMQEQLLRKFFDRIEQDQPLDQDFLDGLAEELSSALPEEMREAANLEAVVVQTKAKLDSPWFKFFAAHEPGPTLEKTTCPVLVIIGEKDTQVDPKLNMPAIKTALQKGGNQDFELKTMPNLNHLFQKCKTGLPGEYARIEETVSPQVLELMAQWLSKRIK